MRLRNKKTGEIWDIPKMRHPTMQEDDISFFVYGRDEGHLFSYKSLAELNEEWEDYNPKEPLIKNEKIRKAVRAWAEANKTNHVWVSVASDGINITQDEQYPPSTKYKQSITFECEAGFKSSYYTITELCGEEEG